MSHITLVRHGQANSDARDEEGYDRLSDLGWDQARWLGAHFDETGETFARVYCGTLRRQCETAQAIAAGPDIQQDARLNELEYFTLAQLMEAQHGTAIPQEHEAFLDHLPLLFTRWHAGELEGAPESFAAFEARVREVIGEIAQGAGRALVVTSGGVIGTVMRYVMALEVRAMARICLTIENSSVHRLQPLGREGDLALLQFNATPHLEGISRQFARSHV